MRHDKPRFKGLTSAEGQIDVLTNKIINLGAPTNPSDAARLQDITAAPGFYGNNVKLSNDAVSFSGINTFSFQAEDFYLHQNAPNTDEIVISLRSPVSLTKVALDFASSVEWVAAHSLGTEDLVWSTYDDAREGMLPSRVDISDPNTAYFYFAEAVAGKAVLIG